MKQYTKIFRANWLSELWGFANYNSAWVAWSRGWRPDKKQLKKIKRVVEKLIKEGEADARNKDSN